MHSLFEYTKRKEESDTSDDSDDSNNSSDSDGEFDEFCSGLLGEIARTINKCKKMVRYVRKTGLNKKIQDKSGFCLMLENQTRWLSLRSMLNSIERSYDVLIPVLSEVNRLIYLQQLIKEYVK